MDGRKWDVERKEMYSLEGKDLRHEMTVVGNRRVEGIDRGGGRKHVKWEQK